MKTRPNWPSVGATFAFFAAAVAFTGVGLVAFGESWRAVGGFEPAHSAFLAGVHALLLGGLLSVYLGAAHQLYPVISERRAAAGGLLAWTHAVLHLSGTAMMVVAFWGTQHRLLVLGGSLVALGLLVFGGVALWALERRRAWTPESLGLYAGLWWLLLALGLGLWMASFRAGWVGLPVALAELRGLHLRAAFAGFFLQVLLGLSHRLVPMFIVSRQTGRRAALFALLLLNAGLACDALGLLAELPGWVQLGDALLACSILPHGIATALQIRSRLRPLGGSFWSYALGTFGLGLVALAWLLRGLGMGLPFSDWVLLAALLPLALVPIAFAVSARVVPFLAWQVACAPLLGRQKLPTVQQLWSERLLWGEFGCVVLAALAWTTFLIEPSPASCLVALTATVALFAIRLINCGQLWHRIRPFLSRP
ncbi:MAG: hypothetical protein Q7P63_15650 [Verrucomicrobiota bacterium JB022]|nr:hypothetical protein [Verrucomicrobiota bacterium JB022]